MKKRRGWVICLLACLLGVLILAAGFFRRFPDTAPAAGGLLACAGAAALLRRGLMLRFAPCRAGEKLVEQFVRTGKTVHFFCLLNPENPDAETPDIVFGGVVRKHEGLKRLEVANVSPKGSAAWMDAHPEAEWTAALLDGAKGLWLTGMPEGPRGADQGEDGFWFRVDRGKISGRTKEFHI